MGVRNGFLARGSRSEARGRRSGAAWQRWGIRSSALPKLPALLVDVIARHQALQGLGLGANIFIQRSL